MEAAHASLPALDWEAPPAPDRANARLYLPEHECVYEIVGYDAVPQGTVPAAENTDAEEPPVEERVATTKPKRPRPTEPAEEEPVETLPPILVPITAKVDSGTTIPPDVLDPNAPLPSIEPTRTVTLC
jgi:hypothetical protein